MGRPDGRIEKGQRLATSISARAWNRAQDAADRILGANPGIQAPPIRGPEVTYISARLQKANADEVMGDWPNHITMLPQGHKLRAGFGVSLSPDNLGNGPESSLGSDSVRKNDLSELSALLSDPFLTIRHLLYGTEQFGIIADVYDIQATEEEPAYYGLKLIVGGMFVCRCLSFALTDRIAGPIGIPQNNNMKPQWYPYPVMTPAGSVKVMAVGNYWRITANEWPRVYEVLVKM
jgi:hypothetical protein